MNPSLAPSENAPPSGDKPLLRALGGDAVWPPPVWLMRQAGRYLPEYRELRAQAGSFLDLCYTPALAAEVTLQPIRRFGFGGAILFSDILVVPHALGQALWFVEGEGPRLEPIASAADLKSLDTGDPQARLAPVIETVARVRAALPTQTALIGFCGAPWTVASYMIAGRGTADLAPIRQVAAADPGILDAIVERLVAASVDYLLRQVAAGCDALQIFESHAGALDGGALDRWSFEPVRRIVAAVKAQAPSAPVIVFARGAGARLPQVAPATGADAVGIDQSRALGEALAGLPPSLPTQGNLDPDLLLEGGPVLDRAVDQVLAAAHGRPHVFNLGHGIDKRTPVAHVERLLARIRAA